MTAHAKLSASGAHRWMACPGSVAAEEGFPDNTSSFAEEGTAAQTLGLDGSETFDVVGLSNDVKPRQKLTLRITRADGQMEEIPVVLRIDTPIEVEYYRHGGILPFVLRELMAAA